MTLQVPYVDMHSDWAPPKLAELPSWADAKRVAVDVETCDPQIKELGPGVRRGAFIAGIAIAIEDGPSAYLPIAHEGGDNLNAVQVVRYLQEQARAFRGEVVGMNLPYDLDFLEEMGVIFPEVRGFRDVGVAEPLIDELQRGWELSDIAHRHGLEGKREDHIQAAAERWGLDPKAEIWRLPARHVADYAVGDVELPLRLLRRQELEIERQELWDVWNLECDVLPITVRMRRRGIRIDVDRLDQIATWAHGQEEDLLTKVKEVTGVEIPPADIAKKDLIARAIEATGYKLPKTATGLPKTDRDTLEAIDHDVPRWIVRAKKFHKMGYDFVGSIHRHLVGDRIHCTTRQIRGTPDGRTDENGVAFGRTSCVDPNLQQQYNPEKEPEISGMWRGIFRPDEDGLWASGDYSAQEPRWAVHYAALTDCDGAREMAENWRADPEMCLHTAMATLIGRPCRSCDGVGCGKCKKSGYARSDAKAIYLGLSYGMGGAKLCRSLGLPTDIVKRRGRRREVPGEEGENLLRQFDELVPFIRQLARRADRRAQTHGYIRTYSGRRCRFPVNPWKSRGEYVVYDDTRKALNRLIQGSSADQMKMALVAAERAGHPIQLIVHDEMNLTVDSPDRAEEVKRIMEETVELLVPTIAGMGVGSSWGEAK